MFASWLIGCVGLIFRIRLRFGLRSGKRTLCCCLSESNTKLDLRVVQNYFTTNGRTSVAGTRPSRRICCGSEREQMFFMIA